MKNKICIKYKDSDEYFSLDGYSISMDIVKVLMSDNIPFKHCGFILYGTNGEILKDCSDFIYRWDILNEENPIRPNVMVFTNNSDLKQEIPFLTQEEIEEAAEDAPTDPLTNEELTEAIADLICEVSLMQLNI